MSRRSSSLRVEKNGHPLRVECPRLVGEMQADQTKLRQALFNLPSNAARFIERGRIELRAESGEWRVTSLPTLRYRLSTLGSPPPPSPTPASA
jgi:signal transduction histidine kinase